MKLDKNGDFIGTYYEHLEKLLDTHDCLCDKARAVIRTIVDDAHDAKHAEDKI